MENQVPEQVKTVRSNVLLKLDKIKREAYEENWLGKTVEVLMEESIQIDGKAYQVGHTKEYVKVAVATDVNLQNKLVSVLLPNKNEDVKVEEYICGKLV